MMDLKDKENIAKISPLSTMGRNYHHQWLRNREYGHKTAPRTISKVHRELYSTIRPIARWECSMSSNVAVPGGIFNLEFSPDGSIMAAACEKRSILLFDPISQMYLHSIDNAHGDCVNCVRFLDSRMFATCSDDKTVALWDTRNLKTRIRVLNGHENWVKNVEYSKDDKLLVTSGFDGSIFTWDINGYTERGLLYKRVFHTNGLMRMRLLPDASKMVICTTGGYIMVIHNLNLEELPADLQGFKPNMYRLMQVSDTTIPVAARYTYLFNHNRKRNRLEFISDFPEGDEAEVICSLQIHPQGWCALTRNTTTDEHSEWTCVHDIQDYSVSNDAYDIDVDMRCEESSSLPSSTHDDPSSTTANPARGGGGAGGPQYTPPHHHGPESSSNNRYEVSIPSSDVWEALLAIHESRDRPSVLVGIPPFTHNVISNGVRIVRMASGIEDQYLYEEEVNSSDATSSTNGGGGGGGGGGSANETTSSSAASSPWYDELIHNVSAAAASSGGGGGGVGGSETQHIVVSENVDASGASESGSSYNRNRAIIVVGPYNTSSSRSRTQTKSKYQNQIPANHRVHRNTNRLTHFIDETNVGKGFIKELGFSHDGRIICSPFSYGVRLLAFDESCSELNNCVTDTPVRLHEIGASTVHSDVVLCTKFSSQHCLLASGCQSGHIIWYQPVL